MYSAFSLRSPCAAAADTSSVIFGRSTSQRRFSSACSARYPSGVMCCVPFGRGASSRSSSSSSSVSLVNALFMVLVSPPELLLDGRREHVGHALILGGVRMPVAARPHERVLDAHVDERDLAEVAVVRSHHRLHVRLRLVVLRGAEHRAEGEEDPSVRV